MQQQFNPFKPPQQPENEMCSNLQQDRPSRTAMLDDATSLRVSGSYVVDHVPSLLDLNNQNPIMSGYPVYSAVEGEPICDLLAGAHISGHPLYMDPHTHNQGLGDVTLAGYRLDGGTASDEQLELEEGGTLVPAIVLASLLASRGCVYENVDDPAFCHASNSRAFGYEDDPSTTFERRHYNNQMQGGMADDVWLQPHTFFYGNGFESHTAEKGYCPNNTNLVADYPYGPPMFNNELSLSLATLQPNRISQPLAQDHRSELSCSSVPIHHDSGRGGSEQPAPVKINDGSLSYASYRSSQPLPTSSGSSYILAIQQILADLSRFSLENVDLGSYSSCSPSNMASNSGEYSESGGSESQVATLSLQREEVVAKKKQLKVLLKMADEGYNQCLKEVHNVMSAFHAMTGLDPEVHVHFVLQTTSFLYKSLKERISAHILKMTAHLRSDSMKEQEGAFDSSFIHKQWALQQLRRKEHQLWRPQRGLPERSVSVLRAWMFQNFLHPYPKDSEKHVLAIKSGLTRSQVSNWFINARVRLWKPMIEEMYAEINRRKTHWKGHVTENSARGDSSMGIQRFQCD